jgi:GNAT superfamily N-acetyltransferase
VSSPAALPVTLEDVGAAAAVIARAFHDDELTVHLYPDGDERRRLTPLMFDAIVRYDVLFGCVDRLPGLEGVATWVFPDAPPETPDRLAQAGFDDLPEDVPLDRLDAVFGSIGPVIHDAAPEPHWHLRLLGVDPGRQGSGLGAVLLRHGLERAAEAGYPVLLETFSERALPFYLRNGFDVIVDGVEPSTGIRFWALRHAR